MIESQVIIRLQVNNKILSSIELTIRVNFQIDVEYHCTSKFSDYSIHMVGDNILSLIN